MWYFALPYFICTETSQCRTVRPWHVRAGEANSRAQHPPEGDRSLWPSDQEPALQGKASSAPSASPETPTLSPVCKLPWCCRGQEEAGAQAEAKEVVLWIGSPASISDGVMITAYCSVLFFFFLVLAVITQDVTDLKSQYKDLLVRILVVFQTDWDLIAE